MTKFDIDIFTKLFHEQYILFFGKCNRQSLTSIDFACDYYEQRTETLDSIRVKFGVDTVRQAVKNEWQIGIAAMLGLRQDLYPAILHLKNPNHAIALLCKFLKNDQFPSLYYNELHHALSKIAAKKVVNATVHYWYHCLEEVGCLYDHLTSMSSYHSDYDLKWIHKISRQIQRHYLSEVQTKIHRHRVKSERSLVNAQKQNTRIVVYRGFSVRPHQNIRVNRTLCENPQCFSQDAGAGINYTLNRRLAEEFARHPFTRSTYICDFQTRVKISQLMYEITETSPDNFVSPATPYVATYLLDPKDILLNLSACVESEIVALHDSVKLVRYDPVSYERF